MKYTKYLALGLTPVMALAMGVGAVYADGLAETTVTTEAGLLDCLAADAICTLDANIELTQVEAPSKTKYIARGETVLDLNGHTISLGEGVKYTQGMINSDEGADLTIKDSVGSGKITTGEVVEGVEGTYAAVQTNTNSKLTVEGGTLEGYYYGVVGNGRHTNTTTTINGGTIRGLNPGDTYGIYHPQTGTLTINGGIIESEDVGIEIRSGNLIMNNGTVIGKGDPTTSAANGGGTTTHGAGIAVVQHTTGNEINVEIKGGKVEGLTAVFENNTQGNTGERGATSVTLSGGEFIGFIDIREEGVANITGGSFDDENVMDYMDNEGDYGSYEDEEGQTVVARKHTTSVKAAAGFAEVELTGNGVEGETMFIAVTVPSGKRLKGEKPVVTMVDGGATVEVSEVALNSTPVMLADEDGIGGDEPFDDVVFFAFTMPAGDVQVAAELESPYSVDLETATNGTPSIEKTTYFAGDLVKVTLNAKAGYKATKVEYSVAENVYVEVPISDDGTIATFNMPELNITVRVTYAEDEEAIGGDVEDEDKGDDDNKGTEDIVPDDGAFASSKGAGASTVALIAGLSAIAAGIAATIAKILKKNEF